MGNLRRSCLHETLIKNLGFHIKNHNTNSLFIEAPTHYLLGWCNFSSNLIWLQKKQILHEPTVISDTAIMTL